MNGAGRRSSLGRVRADASAQRLAAGTKPRVIEFRGLTGNDGLLQTDASKSQA